MIEIVMTLVFSVVMLLFMAFPAMKIVEFIKSKRDLDKKMENRLLIAITIFLSLGVGTFLSFY
jgi:uncharacterized membrane protein YwzB